MSMNEFKDIFDKKFFDMLKSAIIKTLRRALPIIIMTIVISNFYVLAVIPSESMYPTLKVKDLVLIKRGCEFKRGDIIAFEDNNNKSVIKRVIGLPGESIEIVDGIVKVNNEQLVEDYLNEKPNYYYPKTIIPKESYFLLGDNRNNSNDSHFWGFLKKEKIKGKAKAILLPFRNFKIF